MKQRRNRRKKSLRRPAPAVLLLASVLLLTLSAGCGKNGGQAAELPEAENPAGEVRMAYLAHFGMEYVESMATQFCLENKGSSILVEQAEDDMQQDDFRDRIMLELSAGKGPELLWVFEEDLQVLSEKGLLMDLGPLIPRETKKQIFPSVLEACSVDGRLVAVTPEIYFETLVTANDTWKKNRWTREEFLDLLEKKRDNVEWPVTFFSNRLDYYSFLDMVLLTDYSDFIDMKRGTCSFDSEEFRRILRVCKEYGTPDNVEKSEDERLAMLKDGRSLAVIDMYSAGLWLFSSKMNMYGDECHIVGFPAVSGEDGHYLYSNGYLVVNANAANRELIGSFLAYLWNYDNQFGSWLSVRRDVIRDKLIVDESTGRIGENLGTPENPAFNPIETKPDGSSYQKEFIKLLESCVPRPARPEAVRKILQEELAYYFEGSKSAEEVSRIIQNRVQLYLDERQ